MRLKKFLKTSSLLLATISLTGCALFTPRVETETVVIRQNIPIQERPSSVDLHPVKFYAVSENNLESFLEDFRARYGDIVFFAITVPHYENMSLNLAELRRFILQQRNLIMYYETSIQQSDNEERGNNE